jgi:hypothetical protein
MCESKNFLGLGIRDFFCKVDVLEKAFLNDGGLREDDEGED